MNKYAFRFSEVLQISKLIQIMGKNSRRCMLWDWSITADTHPPTQWIFKFCIKHWKSQNSYFKIKMAIYCICYFIDKNIIGNMLFHIVYLGPKYWYNSRSFQREIPVHHVYIEKKGTQTIFVILENFSDLNWIIILLEKWMLLCSNGLGNYK